MRDGRQLSLWRVFLAILILLGLGLGCYFGFGYWKANLQATAYKPWFGSYVDVTATPTFDFGQLGATKTSDVILSFIVSDSVKQCTPTWGAAYSLDEASQNLDLDRRIARLQQQGGRIAVSFGGAKNNELALYCDDPAQLAAAYTSVIDRYHIDTIDLDLEGTSLTDTAALKRRAEAIKTLQSARRSAGKSLAVWLTLPVAPQGLPQESIAAVKQMLESGVDLAGVNVMTMDFGQSKVAGQTMLGAATEALSETHRQLGVLYKQNGINLTSKTLWTKIGVTPMIGQNDIQEEVFTMDDAKGLNIFALNSGVGRMSMWSANRDIACGENYVNTKLVSDSCSGIHQELLGFTQVLGQGFDGDLTQNATLLTENEPMGKQQVDDPTTSPYQVWQKLGTYPAGVKVVWHANVYQAKWWTRGDLPDNPVLQNWETPWQLVGPVLPGDKPMVQPVLPKGIYPIWSNEVVYQAGYRVLFSDLGFEAKWWNQGQSPAASFTDPDNSPWQALSQEEIQLILNKTK